MQDPDDLKGKLNKVSNEVKGTSADIKDKAANLGKTLKDKALGLGSVVKNKSLDLAYKAKDKTLAANETTRETIKNNPYKSVGIALLAGFTVAKIRSLIALAKDKNA